MPVIIATSQPGPGTVRLAKATANLLAAALNSLGDLLFRNVRYLLRRLLCLLGVGLCCGCGLGAALSGNPGRSTSMFGVGIGGGVGPAAPAIGVLFL